MIYIEVKTRQSFIYFSKTITPKGVLHILFDLGDSPFPLSQYDQLTRVVSPDVLEDLMPRIADIDLRTNVSCIFWLSLFLIIATYIQFLEEHFLIKFFLFMVRIQYFCAYGNFRGVLLLALFPILLEDELT
uniref:Transmembrane protein n=1 Tax=Heterorhabditis bacteriophora TaxID=37862 RepID=A0A1I7WMG4_HETBA